MTMYIPLAITTVFVAYYIINSAIVATQSRKSRQRIIQAHECKDPPRERPWDLFGLWKAYESISDFLSGKALASMNATFNRYGTTYSTCILGTQLIVTCHPRNMRQILVDGFPDYYASKGLRDHLFRPVMEGSIFMLDGPSWKSARNLFRGVFSNTRAIVDLAMYECVFQDMKQRIPKNGNGFDFQEVIHMFTNEAMIRFALGESAEVFESHQKPEKKKYVDALRYVKDKVAMDGFLGDAHVLTSKKRFYAACAYLHSYTDRIVEQKLAERAKYGKTDMAPTSETYCLLDFLVENSSEIKEIRVGLLTVLIAGIDSVAALLSATFWLLARHPRVYTKLRQEVLSAIGEQATPTYDQLKSLTYLRYVLNEAMRVLPPVPFNGRIATTDTWLPTGGGPDGESPVFVKKGNRVVFSAWASHRNVKTYGEDALQFHPERWENIKADGFIPFNLGPRACPGQHQALIEASYVAVRLVQTFANVMSDDSRDWAEHLGLNLGNKNGVNLGFVQA